MPDALDDALRAEQIYHQALLRHYGQRALEFRYDLELRPLWPDEIKQAHAYFRRASDRLREIMTPEVEL